MPTVQHKMDEHSCRTATSDAIHSTVLSPALTKHPVLPIFCQIKYVYVLKAQNWGMFHVLKKSISMVHVVSFTMCFQLHTI